MWFPEHICDDFTVITNNSEKQSTGGAKFKVYYDTDSQENRAKLVGSIEEDNPINLEADLINFVAEFHQLIVAHHYSSVCHIILNCFA